MKRSLQFKDLFKRVKYRAIIQLLLYFQGDEGLRQMHFRYAFISDHRLDQYYTVPKLKKFFGDKLEKLQKPYPLVKQSMLPRNCIGSRQKLNNYLSKLGQMGVVEKSGKFPDVRYHLSLKYYQEILRRNIIDDINRWSTEQQTQVNDLYNNLISRDKLQKVENKSFLDSGLIFGLPKDFIKNLSRNERVQVCRWLMVVEENLQNILKLKVDKMKGHITEVIKEIIKGNLPFDSFEKIHEIANISYYYQCHFSLKEIKDINLTLKKELG